MAIPQEDLSVRVMRCNVNSLVKATVTAIVLRPGGWGPSSYKSGRTWCLYRDRDGCIGVRPGDMAALGRNMSKFIEKLFGTELATLNSIEYETITSTAMDSVAA